MLHRGRLVPHERRAGQQRLCEGRQRLKKALIIIAIAIAWLKPAAAATVAIAAAADLTFCIQDLNKAYHQSHPDTELKLSTGSSGNFYTQIEHGAPYDVFLSAD